MAGIILVRDIDHNGAPAYSQLISTSDVIMWNRSTRRRVSPVEIETVIMRHPGVFHVAVTGISDRECGELVVACVVPKPGCSPTAQEIKDLVKKTLTDTKQLRGGVIFMKELPQTSTSKIHRKKLKELVLTMPRE